MIQQQELEKAIDNLNSQKLSTLKTFKSLKIVIKALQQYTSNPDVLPPETLIPCTLFIVPSKLTFILSLPQNQFLTQKPSKLSYDLLLQMYLKSLLKLCHNSSQQINHVVVEGMSRCVHMLVPYPKIAKKWIKTLISLWSTSAQNLNIPLRCHLALSKYLNICDDNSYMWTLRRLYVDYFQNCKQVSWRNYEHINFMINSFCEVCRINGDRAYYVLFGYLRSISLLLDKLNKAKKKEKVEMITKLFSNQILNCLKLFCTVIYRVQSQQMTALIYPLCQLLCAYERITQCPQYIPLKLHILEYQLKIMQQLHIYIPHAFQLIKKLLNNAIFVRKVSKKSEKVEANIEIAYKLSKAELSQSHLLNEIFKSIITKVYMFEVIVSTNVGGSQVISQLYKFIKQKQFIYSGYKELQRQSIQLLKQDASALSNLRRKLKMGLSDNKAVTSYENKAKKKKLKGTSKYVELKEEEEEVLKTKLAAQNQDQKYEKQSHSQEGQVQDDEQVNSGWQSASQGASQYDFNQAQSEENNKEEEVVSYEGDPQDVDEAIQMWQQQQWDSQDEIDGIQN